MKSLFRGSRGFQNQPVNVQYIVPFVTLHKNLIPVQNLAFFLLQVVAAYNADPSVHGILVQLPLPKHICETRILDAISIEKDVDG